MIQNYYDGSDVLTTHNGSSDYVRISPSSISKFFSFPRIWWGETMLGEEGFQGSTSSIIGNIVHHNAEQVALGKPVATEEEIASYLLSQRSVDYDKEVVLVNYDTMSDILVSSCVEGTKFHSVEQFIYHELLPGIYAAGTYDALRPTGNGNFTLRDYKTASQKPSSFSAEYRRQLHTYAYVLRKRGTIVDQVELCYVTRPTKTLPARYFTFIEPFTEEDYEKIESQLMTIAHSIKLWQEQPEIRFALAQDFRLYEAPKPKMFKD